MPCIKEGGCDLKDIASDCELSVPNLKDVIYYLEKKNIVEVNRDKINFRKGAKILTAISALKLGSSIDEVSKVLNWKDFEDFTFFILKSYGYRAFHNFRIRSPRREIDILAIRSELSLAIDCKHRNYSIGVSNLSKVVKSQIKRTRALLNSKEGSELELKNIIPLIVTLYSESMIFINKVPIIPIDKFPNFLLELDSLLDFLHIIR